MARKRDQEDVFQPLNGPSAEPEEPRSSGRGWEIKIGLLTLLLLVGATGYFGYSRLRSAMDADQSAEMSGALQDEGEIAKPTERPSPLHSVTAVAEPQPVGDSRPLAMTQWNAVSEAEKRVEATGSPPQNLEQRLPPADDEGPGSSLSAGSTKLSQVEEEGLPTAENDRAGNPAEIDSHWPPADPEADQLAQPIVAVPGQSYAANYGGDSPLHAGPSAEATFAPMPDPSGFVAGTAAPLPTQSPVAAPVSAEPSHQTDQHTTASSGVAAVPQLPPSAGPGLVTAAQASSAASQPATNFTPWRSPAEATSNENYASSSAIREAPAYSAGAVPSPLTGTAEPSYASPRSGSLPSQGNYPSYAPAVPSRTQADYAGLSATGLTEESPVAEAWQQPSVVPVDGKYSAQPNDNFYTISKKVYGSGAYFQALAKYNDNKFPKGSQIRIGDVVQTPAVETLESRYPELCPKPEHRDAAKQRSAAAAGRSLAGRRAYVVQEGDTLFDIARFELGAASKVADLIELNRDILGDHINYLTPGMRLVLPETDERGPAVTQAPTGTVR